MNRISWRTQIGILDFIRREWQRYQERKAMEQMERRRLDTIRREGQAYAYGAEMGRRRATSDYYTRKRAEQEWRKDPLGVNRMNEFLWGPPPKKRKRRR